MPAWSCAAALALIFASEASPPAKVAPAPVPTVKPAAAAADPAPWLQAAGELRELDQDWRDGKRDRLLPVRVYLPSGTARAPVLLLSHGLGGSRAGLAYLATHMCARGWICVSLQHPGSDETVWKAVPATERLKRLQQAVADPRQALERVRDVSFALDEIQRRMHLAGDALHGRVEPGAFALAGHSFGGWTALACAGRQTAGEALLRFGEERLRAVIALSPSGQPTLEQERLATARIHIPTLSVTGGQDTSVIQGGMTPARRRLPFEAMDPAPGHYLLWFDKADHMVFNGPLDGQVRLMKKRDAAADTAIRARVAALSAAFLEAQLHHDVAAAAFLQADLTPWLGPAAKLQCRSGPGLLLWREAAALVAAGVPSVYQQGVQELRWPDEPGGGCARCDCSGFCNGLLARTQPQLLSTLQAQAAKAGRHRPLAIDYWTAIASPGLVPPLPDLRLLQKGDLVAIAYPDDSGNTGHVMLAESIRPLGQEDIRPDMPECSQWVLTVIDATSDPHGAGDSRLGAAPSTGLGRGSLRLFLRPDGSPAAYCWSLSAQSKIRLQSEQSLRAGRVPAP